MRKQKEHTNKKRISDRRGIKADFTKMKRYAISEKCGSCETFLGLKGGYSGTGLCGPCCTGDASTIDEFCETW